MPAMTAREFVDTIAVPTVEDFMAAPSQRRGYLACLAVYHIGDYLKPAGQHHPEAVHKAMGSHLGAPFRALQRMATAVKHREKTGPGGVILMRAGMDTARPATGFGIGGDFGGSMNPGGGRAGNVLRLGDKGGRYVDDNGTFYDMLDLCLIVLRAYAHIYQTELAGSLIDGIRYSTAEYAP